MQPLPDGRTRRVVFVLVLNVILAGGEVTAAQFAHSASLAADAGHNLVDVASMILSVSALRLSLRTPTATRSFGYLRANILAGAANLVVVLVVALAIVFDSIDHIVHPPHVHGATVAVVAGLAILVNLLAARIVHRSENDLNSKSVVVHLASDAVASAGVLVAGLIILTTGRFAIIDPIVSLLIALLIGTVAFRLGAEYLSVLLEAAPSDVDMGALIATMVSVRGVTEVHDLHCWSLSSEVRAVSAHVVVDGNPSLEQAQAIGDAIKSELASEFRIAHATLELESSRCEDYDEVCVINVVGD